MQGFCFIGTSCRSRDTVHFVLLADQRAVRNNHSAPQATLLRVGGGKAGGKKPLNLNLRSMLRQRAQNFQLHKMDVL